MFIPETAGTKLYFASMDKSPVITYQYNVGKTKETKEVTLAEFIEVKGWKALGNRLIDSKLIKVEKLTPEAIEKTVDADPIEDTDEQESETEENTIEPTKSELKLPSEDKEKASVDKNLKSGDKDKPGYKPGDTIEFDF